MLLLLIVFFVFSTCTVLLEYYAVQYYYRLREARQRKKKDDCKTNVTPAKSAAPALMETPTGSEGDNVEVPRVIICPSLKHVSHVSATPNVNSNGRDRSEDVVSSQTIRKKETLPLPDGSIQTIVHIKNRAMLDDGRVKETVTVKVLEEDGSVEKEMGQTTSNVYHPMEDGRLEEDFRGEDANSNWETPRKKLYSSPARQFVPEDLLQPMLSPKNERASTSCSPKQLMPCYTITEKPQILLPKNKYSEPRVAMDGENAVVACKQSIHFFAYENERWTEIALVTMPHVYCSMSVAIFGNTIVVGVPKDSSGAGNITTGAVYIYEKQNGSWKEVSKFLPPTDENDNFRGANIGYAVDIDENTVVIGAPSKDSITRKGKVYVLKRCMAKCLSDGWVQHSQIEMNPVVTNCATGKDYFGSVVSIRKNIIAVSDGGETVAVLMYKQDLDTFVSMKGSPIGDANRSKSHTSLALTNDGGVLIGCENNAGAGALFYHKNHPGPSAGRYILHENVGVDLKKMGHKCQLSVYESDEHQIMTLASTSESQNALNQIQIYKRSNGCWNQIAAIENNPDLGNIFGNSVAVSKSYFMVASSNNVYAYNVEI